MSIHLVGGGRADDYDGEVFVGFIEEAAARASVAGRTTPLIGALLVGGGDDAAEYAEAYRGSVWQVTVHDDGVLVSSLGA